MAGVKRGELIQHPQIAADLKAKEQEAARALRKRARTTRLRKALSTWRKGREWSSVAGERGPWCPTGQEGVWCPPCPEFQASLKLGRTCKRCGWQYEHHFPLGMES